MCRNYRGNCSLLLQVSSQEGWVTTIKPKARGLTAVDPCNEFLEQLESLVGTGNIRCGGSRGTIAAIAAR